MTQTHTSIAVLVGSLRSDSVNRRLAEKLVSEAPAGVRLEIVDGLADLPFYNEDLDAGEAPETAQHVRDRVAAADRVLVVTPEYNGTMPAVLKNAIDWLSRPYGVGALAGKPLAVLGTTPTPYGGKWAHADVRRSASVAGAVVVEDATVSQTSIDVDVLADPEINRRVLAALQTLVDHELEASAA
jgi:NAD(P)H-dependent FMN reductase